MQPEVLTNILFFALFSLGYVFQIYVLYMPNITSLVPSVLMSDNILWSYALTKYVSDRSSVHVLVKMLSWVKSKLMFAYLLLISCILMDKSFCRSSLTFVERYNNLVSLTILDFVAIDEWFYLFLTRCLLSKLSCLFCN